MYVCICNAVTERDIQVAVQQGLRSIEELEARLRVSTGCGSCREHAEDCLRRALEKADLAFFAAA